MVPFLHVILDDDKIEAAWGPRHHFQDFPFFCVLNIAPHDLGCLGAE